MTLAAVHVYTLSMPTYRRDELAHRSGVPARTIRYYQSVGVLQRPDRVGKEAVYTDEHVARLEQIAAMRGRGLQLDAIREVFDNEPDPSDWRALFDPRDDAAPSGRNFTDAEVTELLGDRRTEMFDDLVTHGYLVETENGWHTRDFAGLRGAVMLYDLGAAVAVSASIRALVRERIATLADSVVATIRAAAGAGYSGDGTRADLEQFLAPLQAAAREVGGRYFAEEITRAITTGGAQPPPG